MSKNNLAKLKRLASDTINLIVTTYKKVKKLDSAYIRIEEINISSNIVVLYSPGIRTILKLSITEAIEDPSILCRLMPIQACWLGYYSSISPAQCDKILDGGKGLMLRFKKGNYKILSLDRKGTLSYLDVRTKTIYSASPLMIAQDRSIINSFDSSQACYIGILAGIDKSKHKDISTSLPQKPFLRIVK